MTPAEAAGAAWNGFAADRMNMCQSASPGDPSPTSTPLTSTAQARTSCVLSTTDPRVTSTRNMSGPYRPGPRIVRDGASPERYHVSRTLHCVELT